MFSFFVLMSRSSTRCVSRNFSFQFTRGRISLLRSKERLKYGLPQISIGTRLGICTPEKSRGFNSIEACCKYLLSKGMGVFFLVGAKEETPTFEFMFTHNHNARYSLPSQRNGHPFAKFFFFSFREGRRLFSIPLTLTPIIS